VSLEVRCLSKNVLESRDSERIIGKASELCSYLDSGIDGKQPSILLAHFVRLHAH